MKRKVLLISLAALILIPTIGLYSIRTLIVSGLNGVGSTAENRFPELARTADEVTLLIALLDDTTAHRKDRDRAIWALGQLRDARALPALRRHYDGGKCDHETRLCQYEIGKAITLCESESRDWLMTAVRR